MKTLIILFFGSLLLGQLGGISLWPGIVIYVHDVLLAIMVAVSLVQLVGRKKWKRPALLAPIALFIAAAILSLVVNYWRFPLPDLALGSLYLVRWILYAAAYAIVLQSVDVSLWLNGLYATGVGFGVLGLIQFFWYPDLRNLYYLGWDPHYYRLFSTLLDPNFVGILLVLTLLLGFGLWKKKHKNYLLVAGQFIALVALLLTYSRSSYAALAGAVVCWSIWTRKWKVLLAIVGFGAVIFLLPRISGDTLKLTRLPSSQARIGNWQESLQLIAKAPVFGYGFDTLRYAAGTPLDTSGIISKSAAGLDSSILFILATTGIIGLVAYGFLIYSMIRTGSVLLRNQLHAPMGMVYIASLVAIIVHSLFVNSMFYPWVMLWIWILTGVVEKEAS